MDDETLEPFEVIDPGHIYNLRQLGTDEKVELKFIKRSGGAIQYDKEWPGLQVQEVIRALIDRSEYLNAIIPCAETEDSIYFLRMALYSYEARAYRRKKEELNRKQPEHDDGEHVDSSREDIYAEVPFTEYEIEQLPIGKDGHIVVKDKDQPQFT